MNSLEALADSLNRVLFRQTNTRVECHENKIILDAPYGKETLLWITKRRWIRSCGGGWYKNLEDAVKDPQFRFILHTRRLLASQ